VSGLIGLSILSGAGAAMLGFDAAYRVPMIACAALCAGSLLLVVLALGRGVRSVTGLSRASGCLPFASRIARLGEAFNLYGGKKGVFGISIFLTLVLQVLFLMVVWIVGQAFGVNAPFETYLLLVPLTAIAAALPGAPPGGWGVGEGAFILLFGFAGVPPEQALAMSVISRMSVVALSLLGIWPAVEILRHGRQRMDKSKETPIPA